MRSVVAGIAMVFGSLIGISSPGCGEAPIGDAVVGTATFKGAPIPAGMIYFEPDASAGGSGAQGAATIKDGAFDTSQSGQGAPTGAVVVRIEGYEKNAADPASFGTMICKWETKDMVQAGAKKTYEVPESAAVAAPKTPVVQP